MNRSRDRSFLELAVLAGTGGIIAIAVAIGFPTWQWLHHRPATPAFFFFALWGIAALCGAAMNVHTYFISGPPPERPPRGGVPVIPLRRPGDVRAENASPSQRKAA